MLTVKGKLLSMLIIAVLTCAAIITVFYSSTLDSSLNDQDKKEVADESNDSINQLDDDDTEPQQTPSPTPTEKTITPSSSTNGGQQQIYNQTFDSGWINITDKAGMFFDVFHQLNSANFSVAITGKTTADEQENSWPLRSYDLRPGFDCSYGGSQNGGIAYSVIQTNDGGYVIFGFVDLAYIWPIQAGLIKVNSAGEVEWNRTYGGPYWGIGQSVVKTDDGGYALLARRIHYETNDYDYWLIKTDANGEAQWNQTYGGAKDDYAEEVVVTSDGGFAILGFTQSFGAGKTDFWLIKTDSLGNMEWNQTYGGVESDQACSLIRTVDGGYAMAGLSGPDSNFDYWLVKTDAYGNKQWDRYYGKQWGDFVCTVVQTQDGGYALAGRGVSLRNNVWLVKTDINGDMLWEKDYGGENYDDARYMIETSDGGFAITGYMDGRVWILKTDSLGNLKWSEMVSSGSTGECIIEDSDGYLVVAGGSNDGGVLLFKTCLPTGLAIVGTTENTITLYRDLFDSRWNYVRVVVTRY